MREHLSNVARAALDKCRSWPVEIVIANSDAAKDLARGIADLRGRDAGIPIKVWETVQLDLAGKPVMYSAFVEGYGAPIHVYLKDDRSRDLPLMVYTFASLMDDFYFMGKKS